MDQTVFIAHITDIHSLLTVVKRYFVVALPLVAPSAFGGTGPFLPKAARAVPNHMGLIPALRCPSDAGQDRDGAWCRIRPMKIFL